jgi:prolyl-tRNA synthetase
MTHSDDDGLRLPPRMAPQQIVIVPILRDEASRDEVIQAAETLAKRLRALRFDDEPVRVKVDLKDDSPANKRWGWIKKGVPFVVELGPRDVAAGTVALVRRDAIAEKRNLSMDEFVAKVTDELNELDQKLHDDALAYRQANMVEGVANFADLREHFEVKGGTGFVRAKYSGDPSIDAKLGELGLTIRCLPYEQSDTEGPDLVTGAPATVDAIYAKAY